MSDDSSYSVPCSCGAWLYFENDVQQPHEHQGNVETAREFVERLKATVGSGVRHAGGSAGVYEFAPDGSSTEFWGYENAVSNTVIVNQIIHMVDPSYKPGIATHYAGGRDKPRTFEEAMAESTSMHDGTEK